MEREQEQETEQEQPVAEQADAAAPAAASASTFTAGERPAPRQRDLRDLENQDRPRRRGRGRRRPCVMCVEKMTFVDYKDFNFLRRFVSDRGRIDTRRKTGTCAKHQRALAQAIKRARHLALLPYTAEHVRMGVTSFR
ncbi:hypothetical protein LCGC14_1834260 [marine sediment metagenome]|uniref:30S ribosomal protein S18 n=1 Tax=marine sediment metagenome TaxID=412755 RepID=A0A0F9JEM7_9ZZZZ